MDWRKIISKADGLLGKKTVDFLSSIVYFHHMKITKANPILGNSSPEILKLVKTPLGEFQIKWIEELDSHALFLDRGEGGMFVASHNNGHSLFNLIERVQGGMEGRILAQLDYIRACGGTVAAEHFFKK